LCDSHSYRTKLLFLGQI